MNKQFADYEYKITFDGRTRNKHRVVKKCTLKPSFLVEFTKRGDDCLNDVQKRRL